MNSNNEALGRQVAQASREAEKRDGAAAIVQNETNTLRNCLGGLERARASGGMSNLAVDNAQHNLLAVALARFQAIARAQDNQLHRLLDPHYQIPEPSRTEQAANVIWEAEAAGARLHAFADGMLEVHRAASLPAQLRTRAATFRAEIVAALRKDVLVIAAPA